MNTNKDSYVYNLTEDQVIYIYKTLGLTPVNANIVMTPSSYISNDKHAESIYKVMRSNYNVTSIGINGVSDS